METVSPDQNAGGTAMQVLSAADRAILQAVYRELTAGRTPADGNAPGHSHSIPGVWDDDNKPETAGKPCAWCLTWHKFTGLIAAGASIDEAYDAPIERATIGRYRHGRRYSAGEAEYQSWFPVPPREHAPEAGDPLALLREELARACETLIDQAKEDELLAKSRSLAGKAGELEALKFWSTVSTYNSGIRKCAKLVRTAPLSLAMTAVHDALRDAALLQWLDSARVFVEHRHGRFQIRRGNLQLSAAHRSLRAALEEARANDAAVPAATLQGGQWTGVPISQFPELQEQVRKGLESGTLSLDGAGPKPQARDAVRAQVVEALRGFTPTQTPEQRAELAKLLPEHEVQAPPEDYYATGRPWTDEEAIEAAHAAGFAGNHWIMGPEELAHLLTLACGPKENPCV